MLETSIYRHHKLDTGLLGDHKMTSTCQTKNLQCRKVELRKDLIHAIHYSGHFLTAAYVMNAYKLHAALTLSMICAPLVAPQQKP